MYFRPTPATRETAQAPKEKIFNLESDETLESAFFH